MRTIIIVLIALILTMSGMTYLYFSRLNRESTYNDASLYSATAQSGLIFCLQNDKSIFEILKGQNLFEHLLGPEKFGRLLVLKEVMFENAKINNLMTGRDIYISFSPGKDHNIDYLISTQLNDEEVKPLLTEGMQGKGVKLVAENGIMRLTVRDTTVFYLGMDKNLVLLSQNSELVRKSLKVEPSKRSTDFVDYIKANHTLSKNSAGSVFIDYHQVPALLGTVLAGKLSGNLADLEEHQGYAALNYNFSAERLFFSGNTTFKGDADYLNLFSHIPAAKNTIDQLLPENTSSFKMYRINDYQSWRKSLSAWFSRHHEDKKVQRTLHQLKETYHLNPEQIFPRYFKDQLVQFQLGTSEQLAAINLSNGDKVKQLLIDISENYNDDIKLLSIDNLLFSYFGEPFRKFSRPYYVIIDNNMIVANQPSTLQSFLINYRNNNSLIGTSDYTNVYSQISNSSTVTFYLNHEHSVDLVRKNVRLPYYRHFMAKDGLARFSSVIYQFSAEKGTFQSNVVMNTFDIPLERVGSDSSNVAFNR